MTDTPAWLDGMQGWAHRVTTAAQAHTDRIMAAEEAEIARMLPFWPRGHGKAVLIYDHHKRLIGLGERGRIGIEAVILVHADPSAISYVATDIRDVHNG